MSGVAGYVFVLLLGLGSGVLSGTIGTGSAMILLPILAVQYGPKQAVPIMAVSSLIANTSRLAAWWHDIDWRAVGVYGLAGVPAAALGARTLLVLPSSLVDIGLGVFFLAMIPGQRLLRHLDIRLRLPHLALAGAVIGFVTGLAIATGPLSVPVFTAYGLSRGPFLATEAAATLTLMLTKATTFRELGALPLQAVFEGLVIGASVMIGTFIGKALVLRMSLHAFAHVLDWVLVFSGCTMLWAALS